MGGELDGLEFWSTVIGHVFSWPVAVVVSVITLRRPLAKLLGRVLSFSGPGDFKITFSELIGNSGIEARGDVAGKSGTPSSIGSDTTPEPDTNQLPPQSDPQERSSAGAPTAWGRGSVPTSSVGRTYDEIPTSEHLRATLKQLGDWNRQARKRTENLRVNSYTAPEQTIIQAWRMVYEHLELACTVVLHHKRPQKLGTMIEALLAADVLDNRQAREIATLNRLREIAKRNENSENVDVDTSGALEYVEIASSIVDQLLTKLEYWTIQAPRSAGSSDNAN